MNETSPYQDYSQPVPRPENKGSGGKWLLGCSLGCLLSLLLLGGVVFFVVIKAKDLASGAVNHFTSETPVAFDLPEADPAKLETLLAKFEAFAKAMQDGTETEPLEVTGDDINLIISQHPDWEELSTRTRVAIVDDRLSAEISVPMDDVGDLFKGRYLNGVASIRLSLITGKLEGHVQDVSVAGNPLPASFLTQLRAENLFKDSPRDSKLNAAVDQLQELKIENGRLRLVPKPAAERKPKQTPVEGTPEKPES